MVQNVISFLKNHLVWFQIALGVWQILKFTPLAVLIKGLMGRLLSFLLPGFFPAYKQLQHCPGCLFKTVKCVELTKGMSQSKTKRLTNPKKQVTRSYTSTPTSSNETQVTGSEADSRSVDYSGKTFVVKRDGNKVTGLNSTEDTEPTMPSSGPGGTETGASKPEADSRPVDYLDETFEVKMEGNKVSVREWSYYISKRQWNKICQMDEKCFKKKAGKGSEKENEVVFVKGCQLIWQKVATGEVMEFGEVLDDLILENKENLLISDGVWFLPVDLSEKSEGKLPKLLNLVGLIPRVSKAQFLVPTSLTIAAGVLEFWESLRSLIYENIHKMFCGSVQYICNKLPYPVRRFVYLSFIWVENSQPRNDILLEVARRDFLNVFIAGAAKTNSRQEATLVDGLEEEKDEYEFRCGCSIVIKATYDDELGKCKATVQHTNAFFPTEERVFLKCQYPKEFNKIGTLLSCLAASKAGSLFEYDCNDNKVHVRGWRESLLHYKEAGFPDIYKLTLHDVIV